MIFCDEKKKIAVIESKRITLNAVLLHTITWMLHCEFAFKNYNSISSVLYN